MCIHCRYSGWLQSELAEIDRRWYPIPLQGVMQLRVSKSRRDEEIGSKDSCDQCFSLFSVGFATNPTFHKNPIKPYNAVQKVQVSLQLGNIFMTCRAHSADWLPFCKVNQTRSTDVRDGCCNHGSELANTCAPEVEADESNEIVIVFYICLLQNETLNKFLRHSMC